MRCRRATYPLTILLTVATAIGIFATGWLFANPAISYPGSAASEQVVRSFYTAVNGTIRTGDVAELENAVDDNVVTHGSLASIAPDRAGLTRYLLSLHAISPTIELEATKVVASGSMVVVTIAIHGNGESVFLGSHLPNIVPWGKVDAFRIDNLRVTEMWSDASGLALLEPLARTPINIDLSTVQVLSLDRLTIEAGSSLVAVGSAEPRWLFVEAGEVTVESHRDRFGPPILEEAATPDLQQTQLQVGDLIEIPTRSRTELRNIGVHSAVLTVLAISPPAPTMPSMDPAHSKGDLGPVGGLEAPSWQALTQQAIPKGVSITPITASIQEVQPDERLDIVVGRVTLAPGTLLSNLELTGTSLVVVDAGKLELFSDGRFELFSGETGTLTNVALLEEEDAALLRSGTRTILGNPGQEPVTITVVAILPRVR